MVFTIGLKNTFAQVMNIIILISYFTSRRQPTRSFQEATKTKTLICLFKHVRC